MRITGMSWNLIDNSGRGKYCNPYVPNTEFPVTFIMTQEVHNVYFAGVLGKIVHGCAERIPDSLFCISLSDGHYVNVHCDAVVPTGPEDIHDVVYPDNIAIFSGPAGMSIPCVFSFPSTGFLMDMCIMQMIGAKPSYENDYPLGDWTGKFVEVEVPTAGLWNMGQTLEVATEWRNHGLAANRIVIVNLGHHIEGWSNPNFPWLNFEPVWVLSGIWFGQDGEVVKSVTDTVLTNAGLVGTWDVFVILGDYVVDEFGNSIVSKVVDAKSFANGITIRG